MTMEIHSMYYDQRGLAERVSNGEHRAVVGGMWDELGALQLDFLRARGLRPDSRLLDIGCGSLRLGVCCQRAFRTRAFYCFSYLKKQRCSSATSRRWMVLPAMRRVR
jgi:hypothetical protein